jgi:hypothetical protein
MEVSDKEIFPECLFKGLCDAALHLFLWKPLNSAKEILEKVNDS